MAYKTYYQKDYSGGLNDTASPLEVGLNEASLLRNWDITYQGKLVQREGLIRQGNQFSTNPVNGLGAFVRDSGSDLVATDGTGVWALTGNSWTQIANNLTADALMALENVQAKGKIYLSSENNLLRYWDRASTVLNTSISNVTNSSNPVPYGNKLAWFENFMFVYNNVQVSGVKYPHRVYLSALGDPETYTTGTDFFDVPGDGRLITGIDAGASNTGPEYIFFKERSIQILTGYGTTSWKITAAASTNYSIDEEIGCVAPRGVVRVDNDVWFIDNQAQIRRVTRTIYGTHGQDIISTKIRGTLGNLNQTQLSKTVAWYHANKVYFAFPNGSDLVNGIVCVFDLIAAQREAAAQRTAEAWTVYTGWYPSVLCGQITSGVPALYIGDKRFGAVYLHKGDDDAGVAIDCRWDGKENDFGAVDRFKRYAFGWISAEASAALGTVDIYTSVNQSPYALLKNLSLLATGSRLGPTGDFRLGPTGNAQLGGTTKTEDRFYFTSGGNNPGGKTIKMSLRHKVLGEKVAINTFSVNYKLRQLR